MTEPNKDFISRRCQLCGGVDCGSMALSSLRLICGYGADHDMERVDLTICGRCADRIYNKARKRVKVHRKKTRL